MPEFNPFPTDEELWEERATDLRASIHVAMPGRIQSYDPVHQVADIIIGVKDSLIDPEGDGEYMHLTYPVLPAVPILFPRMGRWFMAMSVEPGDAVQLLFNSSAIGVWRRSTRVGNIEGLQRALQGITLVGDVARHHITHAVAVLGLETYGRALNHAPDGFNQPASNANAAMVWGSDLEDGARMTIRGDGSVEVVKGAEVRLRIDADGTVHVGGATASQFVALANLVDSRLSTIRTWLNTHTHPTAATGPVSAPSTPLGALDSVAATKAKAT
jgi:hypothetical protein